MWGRLGVDGARNVYAATARLTGEGLGGTGAADPGPDIKRGAFPSPNARCEFASATLTWRDVRVAPSCLRRDDELAATVKDDTVPSDARGRLGPLKYRYALVLQSPARGTPPRPEDVTPRPGPHSSGKIQGRRLRPTASAPSDLTPAQRRL